MHDQIDMHAQTTGQIPPIYDHMQLLNFAFCLAEHADVALSKHVCRSYTSTLLALLLAGTLVV